MTALLATGIEAALILTVVSVGLSLAAAYLLKADVAKEPLRDEAPTTIATRGSFVPYVIGRRRVGAVFAFAGNRQTKQENVGGATKGSSRKGSSTPKQTIFFEDGWHILCVGPASSLLAIYEAGKPIMSGGITPATHPSGTSVNLAEGSFTIYWGEEDQALGSEVNAAIGINSRWPFVCYVYWTQKRLGPAARWPILDYEIEVNLHTTHLLNSPGNPSSVFSTGTTLAGSFLDPTTNAIRSAEMFLTIVTDRSTVPVGSRIQIDFINESSLSGTYTIFKVETRQLAPSLGSAGLVTVVTLEEAIPDATVGAFIPVHVVSPTLVSTVSNSGANHAHMAAQLLFDPFPHGLGFPKGLFDLTYFEHAGTVLDSENVRGSYRADGGVSFLTCLGHILQDMGAAMPWDVSQGKFLLRVIRSETTSPTLPEQVILDPLPQIQTVHGGFGGPSPRSDKIVFEFADRTLAYRAMTIVVDDDGRASHEEHANARKVQLPTINDFTSAAIVAERRSQEDLGVGAVYRIYANREARKLFPGLTLIANGIGPRLRIVTVEIDPYSGKVEINAITDYYGAKKSTYNRLSLNDQEQLPASAEQEEVPLDEDIETSTGDGYKVYELPGYLIQGQGTFLTVPRIRAHNKIPAAVFHISADGTTYRALDVETSLQTGGELTEAIAADDPFLIDEGPTMDILGSDIGIVEDLTGDNANWYGGRQLAVINDEIFFLRNVTALSETSYRLDGLVRARYDTSREAHSIGDMVRIFQVDSILAFSDLLVKPGNTIFIKVQPAGGVSQIDLSELRPIEHVISGKGLRPMPPGALRTANLRSSWAADGDVRLKWGYRSTEFPGTGAGMQGAGNPTGCSAVKGRFLLEMKTTGGVLKASYMVSDPYFTYYNDDLVSDFTSEPSSFKVVLTHVHGGLKSDSVELTVTRE